MDLRKTLAFVVLTTLTGMLAILPVRAQFTTTPIIGPSGFAFTAGSQAHIWTCNSGQSTFDLKVPAGLVGTFTVTTAQASAGTYTNPPGAFTPGSSVYTNTLTNSGSLTVILGANLYVKVADTAYTSGSVTVSGICTSAVAGQVPPTPIPTPSSGVYPISASTAIPVSGSFPTPIPTPSSGVYPVSGSFPTPIPTPSSGVYPVSGAFPTPIPTPTGGTYPVSGAFPTPIATPAGGTYPISGAPTPIPTPAGGIYPISGAPTPIPTPAGGTYPVSGAFPTPVPTPPGGVYAMSFLSNNAPTSAGIAAITTATTTQIIAGVGAKSTYIYGLGFTNSAATPVNVSIVTGTNANCAAGAATIWGPFYLAATGGGVVYPIEVVAGVGLFVCVKTDATGSVTGAFTEYQL